jgi:photosystem II stability/assembly factor-like uncharacterized protein
VWYFCCSVSHAISKYETSKKSLLEAIVPGNSIFIKVLQLFYSMITMNILGRCVISFLIIYQFSEGAVYRSTNPGGGGAFNSPVLCGSTSNGQSQYFIVGSDLGGLYVSQNRGKTWYAVGSENGGLFATHISSLACTTSRLIVGTDDGIFVGNLNGMNMSHVSPGGYVSSLVVASQDENVIYAGKQPTWDGKKPQIWTSLDHGQTFIQKAASGLPSAFRIVGMRTHPVDSDAVWVISGSGRFATTSPAMAYVSTDQGASFVRLDPKHGDVLDIAYTWNPENLNHVMVSTLKDGVGKLFEDDEAGFGTWTEVTNLDLAGVILANAQDWSNIRLLDVISPNRPIQAQLWNLKTTWTKTVMNVSKGWANRSMNWDLQSGFQGILQTHGYRPENPQEALWATTQFVYLTTDGGKYWKDLVTKRISNSLFYISTGLNNIVPSVIEPSEVDPNLVYAGYMDIGIWRSENGGKSWKSLNPGEKWTHKWLGTGGNTLSIVADPKRKNVVWAQVAGDLYDPLHLLKSDDRGDNWYELETGLPPNPRKMVESIQLDITSSVSSRRLFVIVNGDVYRSLDDGLSWKLAFSCGDCVGVRYTGSGIFAFGPSGVWRSIKKGAIGTWFWVTVHSMSGWTPGLHWVDDFWTYAGPIDMAWRGKSEVWLAIQKTDQGGLLYSSNSGVSWKLIYQDPYLRSVAVDPKSGKVAVGSSSALFAGSYDSKSNGVVVHLDGKSEVGWQSDNRNLVWPFCTYLTFSKTGLLWLISPGEGILKG